jgi:hypothetical protein
VIQAIISIDIDWAPDYMIEAIALSLIDARVKATWFITHSTPTLELLRAHGDLFELGIHPNFHADSTHGQTADEVLTHCREIVPEARSVRVHGLMQSTTLLSHIVNAGFEIDSSLFLPRALGVKPLEYWWSNRRLVRIPFIWEDDFEFHNPSPIWEISKIPTRGDGLRVFNFHPVHVYLNSSSRHAYQALRSHPDRYPDIGHRQTLAFRQGGAGAATMFQGVVTCLREGGGGRTLDDFLD